MCLSPNRSLVSSPETSPTESKTQFLRFFFFFKSLSHNKCCTQDGETSSQDVTCNTQVELEKLVSPISCPVCMPGTKPVPALCTVEFFSNRFLHFCYELLQSQPMHLENFIHAVLPIKNEHFSLKMHEFYMKQIYDMEIR